MPYRNLCRLYIHLAVNYSVGPSSVARSIKFGAAPPFPPMRVLEVYWSRALSLVCEVALNHTKANITHAVHLPEVVLLEEATQGQISTLNID